MTDADPDDTDGDDPTPSDSPSGSSTTRLPDSHPIVKALAKSKADNETLRRKLQEIDDKDKSEVERLNDENQRLKSDLAAATTSAGRYKVALDKGLTLTQAKRLVGTTEEELTADADELLTDLGTKPTDDGGTDRPKPDAKPRVALQPGGGEEPAAPEETDVKKIGARMFGS